MSRLVAKLNKHGGLIVLIAGTAALINLIITIIVPAYDWGFSIF